MQIPRKVSVRNFPCDPGEPNHNIPVAKQAMTYSAVNGNASFSVECLDEVNAMRADNHLTPFEYDSALGAAAMNIALERANAHEAGHTKNDFSGLPEGAHADAAGCAAWPPGTGWGSCCSKENWKYAGAAYCISDDGMRYMQLFVSKTPNKPLFREQS